MESNGTTRASIAPAIKVDTNDIDKLRSLIGNAERVVITCHMSPDGDAMGSTLALWHVLKAMGKRPAVITPDSPPRQLMFLPGARDIIIASRQSEKAKVHLAAADLIVCLDFNALHRIDRLGAPLMEAKAPRVLIDHHLGPEEQLAQLIISRPSASSTCFLLYTILRQARWDEFIDYDAADCLYTGMMTDTGNFSFNSNDPALYKAISWLVGERGVDKDYLYRMACNTSSENRIKLNSYALLGMKVYPSHKAALIVLSADDLVKYNYVKGDTEGLVNVPLSIPDVVWSAYIREDENQIKFSLRSKGDFPVNKVCEEHLGGGGHLNAAGGELHCTLDEAVETFERIMPLYDKYLK